MNNKHNISFKKENANKLPNNKNQISFFSFFSFSASIIITMMLFPTFASSGYNLIFFLIIGAILWFIPVALCSSCLGSTLKWQHGGVFVWIKNSINERFGFAAIFFQWFQSTIIYTILFYFITSGINYLFDTNIFDNNLYKFLLISSLYIIATLIQLFGIKITSSLSKISLFLGVLVPSIMLIVLSFGFVFGTNINVIPPTLNTNVLPSNNISSLVIFSSFILGYTGIEESASSLRFLKKPKRNYPLSIILVAIIIIVINILSSLSISFVLDKDQMSLSGAVYNTFDIIVREWFGNSYIWVSKLMAFLIILGIFGQINSIISGPSRGLANGLTAVNMPKILTKTNSHDVNYVILIIQAVFMIGWLSLITFVFQTANAAFLTCISITSFTYLISYTFIFIGILKISWTKKRYVESIFLNQKWLRIIFATIGLLTTLFTMIVVFFNPDNINQNEYTLYLVVLSISVVIIFIIPFIIYSLNKWLNNKKTFMLR